MLKPTRIDSKPFAGCSGRQVPRLTATVARKPIRRSTGPQQLYPESGRLQPAQARKLGDGSGSSNQQESEGQGGVSTSTPALPDAARVAVLLFLVAVAVAATANGAGTQLLEAVEAATAEAGTGTGAAVFIAVYALATVLLFPASILTLAAGALFGPVQGTAVVSVASTLGAALAFLASRYLVRPLVEERLPQYPQVQAVIRGISSQGIKLVFLLRLSPLFPFNILNYALGITSIGFVEYVGASWLGMLPATFAYVFLGGAGRVAATSGTPLSTIALYAVGAIATLAVTKLASDAASKALKEQEQEQEQQP